MRPDLMSGYWKEMPFSSEKIFFWIHSVRGVWYGLSVPEPLLADPILNGGNGIFWSPDTWQASQATSSQETRSLYFCQYLKVLPWNWGPLSGQCNPGGGESSWTQGVRQTLLTSLHLRKNLFEVRIHLYSAQPLLSLWFTAKPEAWIKMNTTAGAEHPRALHPVGDLLRHLLRHLPRPLPLLRHRVLQLKLLLLLLWQERLRRPPLENQTAHEIYFLFSIYKSTTWNWVALCWK